MLAGAVAGQFFSISFGASIVGDPFLNMRIRMSKHRGQSIKFHFLEPNHRIPVPDILLLGSNQIVFVPHTTAAVTINENADPDVTHDILLTLDELIPQHRRGYQHREGNSDAHVKASLTGSAVTVIVAEGRLQLGTWQGIYFCEFDGPRTRKLHIQVR